MTSLLVAHHLSGLLSLLAALWLWAELGAAQPAAGRCRRLALLLAHLAGAVLLLGGAWYVLAYGADRAVILRGPWPQAHGVAMEIKEHVVFLFLLAALYLPVLLRDPAWTDPSLRRLARACTVLVLLWGVAADVGGLVVDLGVRQGLTRPAPPAGGGS
ncbi:hypothetical protein GALL_242030 [mine drainage metagenome]|uniref:Uncharacterized protein n=1 Tax=mine drainage metagenome TaxID=410659 RepID=A0A1J5RP11_9ZZZZ